MWIDPELDLFVIFLSNRLHPDGVGSVNQLAGRIGTIAASAIRNEYPFSSSKGDASKDGGSSSSSRRSTVLTGIDVLIRDDFQPLAGSRVGLITNHTGVDRVGARTADLLHNSQKVNLVAVFSPEHGLQGKLDQAKIEDAHDELTGLPIYSLYGPGRKPTPEQLAGIDTLVFDIQDIGTRFYTYVSTMGLAMEAAAEQGLRFVVLDRPNPIGGIAVAGPLLDGDKESFVGFS